jgi:TonB family protein
VRPLSGIAFALAVVASSVSAQSPSAQAAPPQSARQALIEMCFGQAPGHFERHLPDVTLATFKKLGEANGQSVPGMFSALAMQAKAGGGKLETFDTGPKLFTTKGPSGGHYEEIYITVERDELVGDEDQIELALHMTSGGKEETLLPIILRFTFSMKMQSEVWRLNEVSATARFPLADPTFLAAMEEHQARQNEQTALWSVRGIIAAEKSFQSAQGAFACTLSALGSAGKESGTRHAYLYDSQLAGGKKSGYVFAISECDTSHYRVVAEPESPTSGQRAFCSDESGTLHASDDGKAATCMVSGKIVEENFLPIATTRATLQSNSGSAVPSAGRVRFPQDTATRLIMSKVEPIYPPLARQARVQGSVVMKAVISQTGDVVSVELVSGHPILAPAALDAVRQWKYRPFMLNGKAVEVETEVTVNFSLSEH